MSQIALENFKGCGDYNLISNAYIYDLYNAVKASKYPMSVDVDSLNTEVVDRTHSLALTPAGTGHNNFLSGIIIEADITMTNKMCVEWQRYHFQQIVSSQSTMHKISKMNLSKAYIGYVDKEVIKIMERKVEKYNQLVDEGKTEEAKDLYLEILYTNPAGMLLTQRIVFTYLQLKTMYLQRKNHRLPEWRLFCKWIESLPYSEWITTNSTEEEIRKLKGTVKELTTKLVMLKGLLKEEEEYD